MKKGILTLAVLASISSMAAVAAEEAPDMSDPTAVYTTLGFGYGDQGLDISSMLMLSSTETQKTGLIFDVKNILNENDHAASALEGHEVNNTSYRLRWGTINTQNGLGLTVDAVNLEHAFWGRMTVVQAGSLMTIPIGDNFIMFPIAFVGGVLVENNTLAMVDAAINDKMSQAQEYAKNKQDMKDYLASQSQPATDQDAINAMIGTGKISPAEVEAAEMALKAEPTIDEVRGMMNASSEGMSMPSTIATGMVYARYAFTDKLWALGSYSYTTAIQGKSWSDKVADGGLQMPEQMYDITIGYQITPTQNITAFYGSDSSRDTDDKWKIGYNYAF